jgi:hypothetical protein
VGRRTRKRSGARTERAAPTVAAQAAPTGARRRRARLDEAPKAPWAPFPLVELCILLALVLIVAGFLTHGSRGRVMLACGLTLVTLSSLELAIREHFAGYRSHTSLLAGAGAVAGAVPIYFLTNLPQGVLPIIALGVFGSLWRVLRAAFQRRSGVGFRA